jgi:hypothetical protein
MCSMVFHTFVFSCKFPFLYNFSKEKKHRVWHHQFGEINSIIKIEFPCLIGEVWVYTKTMWYESTTKQQNNNKRHYYVIWDYSKMWFTHNINFNALKQWKSHGKRIKSFDSSHNTHRIEKLSEWESNVK